MSSAAQRKPNILVLFCDQLRIDILGCYGGHLLRTPNLGALAAESIVFDRAYTPCALCSPARASLMTGVYPHRHHMFNNSTPGYSYCEHLRPDMQILPVWAARHSDYDTAYFGKWHIGTAADLFNSSFGRTHPRPGEEPLAFLANSHWHPNTSMGKLVRSYAGGAAGTIDVPMERFPDVAAAGYTQRFLRERRPSSSPFLAVCAFPGPHSPWLVPDEFGIRYDPAGIAMWPNRRDTFAGKPISQRKLRLLQEREGSPAGGASKDDTLRELLACCFSYMELIDSMVGDVVATLKETGQYDNTMIVFTADHGDMAGAHGFLSKGSYMYDEIYRIPLMVKPDGPHVAGSRQPALVNLMDLTATIMHVLAGAPCDRMDTHRLHGASLLPLLESASPWDRSVHYAQYHGDWYGHYSSRMVTDGRWKLIWNLSDLCELYDLTTDPYEMTNLFYAPECRPVRERYFAQLVDEAARLEDRQLALLDPAIEDQLRAPARPRWRAPCRQSCRP